jgi:DNA-binding CsgD family transcriptional regulator
MQYLEEIIYEACVDDELFAQLPSQLSSALSARSCSLFWQDSEKSAPVFIHSNYYSEDQLGQYFQNFSEHDLWIEAASAPERLNRAWLSSQAIDPERYASSIFFNEWIVPMGDDTFHALGASLQNLRGSGTIGLHRGKTQGDFQHSSRLQLDVMMPHLRRMLSIRSRLAAASRQAGIWREGFMHTPQPIIVADRALRIRLCNASADRLLAERSVLSEQHGLLWISPLLQKAGLGAVLNHASATVSPQAGACIARDDQDRVWKVDVLPLVSGTLAGCAMISIECVDSQLIAEKTIPRLIAMFALTNAEAHIAVCLSNGQSVNQIAIDRRASEHTIRSQIKAIMSKLNAHRQAEVTSIVSRLG